MVGEEQEYKERGTGRGRGRSGKAGDGEDEKNRYEKMGEKEWKEAISVEVGGKTRFRHRGELHALYPPDSTVRQGTGQTGVRHGKLEWSRLYI